MTASSNGKHKRKSSCQPEDGNILSNKGWCAKKSNGKFGVTAKLTLTASKDLQKSQKFGWP